MALTLAQLQALKSDIALNANTIPAGQPWSGAFAGVAVKNVPHTPDGETAVAGWYSQAASPAFFGNYLSVPISAIKAAIKFKNYTPSDAVPTDTQLNASIHSARTVFAQNFQINLNTLLAVGSTFDATNANLVSSLKDATNTSMPMGAAGASLTGGWTGAGGVQTVICRTGNNAEKLFADTSVANGSSNTTAATFRFEGTISASDIDAAFNS